MKLTDLRNKSTAELHKLLLEQKADLANIRMNVLSNQDKRVSQVQTLRRDIARILTVLNDPNRHD